MKPSTLAFAAALGRGATVSAHAVVLTPAFQPVGQPPLVGPIPEPGTFALPASGLLGFAAAGRKRRSTQRAQ